ncbi:hypothetical protein A0H81_05593 [Grifola frondosa]|uniref:NAD(P)-binding domain-containing protein n=1 Tax=Grifola frondosa TaxID=5627 RepID=A0A1C7MBM6_GRIFR|nr:hypothetical protein A0H81_05593 [Grifola frondosa]
MFRKIVIVGGHGKIALRLAHLLSHNTVTSIIQKPSQIERIINVSAIPLVLSLEEASVSQFSSAFQGADVVVFTAGAGGKGGPERTKAVDYEGAVKVFDAIEAIKGPKPRLILVSAVDVRDTTNIPEFYDEADIQRSVQYHQDLGDYMRWKYEADKNLVQRTAFQWTIVRPSTLLDTPGTHTASIGRPTSLNLYPEMTWRISLPFSSRDQRQPV